MPLQFRRIVAWIGCALSCGALAQAQDAATIAKIEKWETTIANPRRVVAPDRARKIRSELASLNLDTAKLAPQHRQAAARVALYAALGVGDIRAAQTELAKLMADHPTDRHTLAAQWLVAVAAGDAQLAQRTLETLQRHKVARASAVAKRQERLRLVGEPVPEKAVVTVSGRIMNLRPREGRVLVLDFWAKDPPPSDKQIQSMIELFKQYGPGPKVEFLGINRDDPDQKALAAAFASRHGYDWPQYYRPQLDESLAGTFGVDDQNWVVVVDGHGNVRAIGAAHEPAFQYALRSAAAEARGEFTAVMPRTTQGIAATPSLPARSPDKPAARNAPPEEKTKKRVHAGDLPSNPEAAKLLNRARLYIKTGRKRDAKKLLQEIVEKYPGTREALDAKERLSYL